MYRLAFSFILLTVICFMGCQNTADTESTPPAEDEHLARAQELVQQFIMVDGHIDIPYRMAEFEEDISQPTIGGDFDYPRAKAGGLNAPFMSIYLPAERQDIPGSSKTLADSLIDMVEGFVEHAPDKFAIATSTDDVQQHFEQGLVSLPMGMENGSGIEDDLANLQHFYDRGIRYITLVHAVDNKICDSSYDEARTWNGLSPFGEQVVDEMNRLGIIVDISHVSDSTFYQVIARSKAPVFASHSSVRHFTPDWERNMNDDMIRVLAENDGVIMINFGSSFLKSEYQGALDHVQEQIAAYLDENNLAPNSPEAVAYKEQQRKANPVGTVQDVADHIDHVVNLVGVDYVGLGSDYDGVFALPEGLQDVSEFPVLVAELLKRGYTDEDIEKILGGNALRVWKAVEEVARGS